MLDAGIASDSLPTVPKFSPQKNFLKGEFIEFGNRHYDSADEYKRDKYFKSAVRNQNLGIKFK